MNGRGSVSIGRRYGNGWWNGGYRSPSNRRACFGELVQIDGSPHDWFEGRREKCCLLVFIDDATSEVMEMRFEERETTASYFRTLRAYIERYGLPLAFYSDQFGVFRVNQREVTTVGETQFGRACKALGIKLICANSPQANGKVERSHRTDQQEFYQLLEYQEDRDLLLKLTEWENFYNCHRPHGNFKGQIPYEILKIKLQQSAQRTQ